MSVRGCFAFCLLLTLSLLFSGCVSNTNTDMADGDNGRSTAGIQSEAGGAQGSVQVIPTTAPIQAPQPAEPTEPAPAEPAESAAPAPPEPVEPVEPVDPLHCLDDRQIIGQVLMGLGTQGEFVHLHELAKRSELGSIALLGTPDSQIASEIHALRELSPLPIWVASDEEGGTVQRFDAVLGKLVSARQQNMMSDQALSQLWADYSQGLKNQGVDIVFGPVIDVGGTEFLGSRSSGSDAATVTRYGRVVQRTIGEAGLIAVLKHFPGHGSVEGDTHIGLATTPPLSQMREIHLAPYLDLLDTFYDPKLAGVMVGHLVVPELSNDLPASLSPAAIDGLLREELGFGGLVFSDALNMGAIVNNYGAYEAVEMSLRAGTDIAILGSFSDIAPTIDHLETVAQSDAIFNDAIRAKALKVLEAKTHQHRLASVCGTG